jgi:very-short-patch-repair endonuclease
MSERRTLSLRGPAERNGAAPPRTAWNVSDARRERLKEMARAMRREPTEAEKALWPRLANQKLGGFKFHRQVVIGSTIVDFACPARWLVVEISGEANAEVAAIQDKKLADVGVRVLRFSEEQVLEGADATIAAILDALQKPFDRRAERAANAAGRPTDAAIREGEQAEDEDMFVTDPDEGEGPDNPMVEE